VPGLRVCRVAARQLRSCKEQGGIAPRKIAARACAGIKAEMHGSCREATHSADTFQVPKSGFAGAQGGPSAAEHVALGLAGTDTVQPHHVVWAFLKGDTYTVQGYRVVIVWFVIV
jgi:hypothetical protein